LTIKEGSALNGGRAENVPTGDRQGALELILISSK
jgi:hypothetical protein